MRFILIGILIILMLLAYTDLMLSANLLLWVYMIFLGFNILKDRYVSIASIFIFGFIYIYFKEILNDTPSLIVYWGKDNIDNAFFVVFFSSISLLAGYYIRELISPHKQSKNDQQKPIFFIANKKRFFRFTVFLTYLIFFGNIVLIIRGLTEGRQNAFEYGILSSFSYAIGVVCIVNFKCYFKQFYGKSNYLKVILYSLPIFLLYLGSGTRFLLLYGIIALVSDSLYNLRIKRILMLGFTLIIIGFTGNFLLKYRNVGLASDHMVEAAAAAEQKSSINEKIVRNFTEEGVFRNAAMINDYSNKNGLTYGSSSSFILYFWVPRIFWQSKPTQIDHWLIRKYTNEYDDSGHSTASGFIGEVFMDFGKYLTVFISFVMGYFLSKLNQKMINAKNDTYFKLLVSSAILAWVFFSVRSVLTSSMMFIYIIFIAYVFSKLFKKWKLIK